MKLEIDATPDKRAGEILTEYIRAAGDAPVLLLLSAGSAFDVLAHIKPSVRSPALSIGMLDERYSSDETINNFSQLMGTTFYAEALAAGTHFFDSRIVAGESATDVAHRFEKCLRTWRADHPDGIIIATLGMGGDGHTAGIFPGYVEHLNRNGAWVEAYEVPLEVNQYTSRITVTPHFLTTEITYAVAYVVGDSKRALLATVLDPSTPPDTYPAALWRSLPNVTVVTDKALA